MIYELSKDLLRLLKKYTRKLTKRWNNLGPKEVKNDKNKLLVFLVKSNTKCIFTKFYFVVSVTVFFFLS